MRISLLKQLTEILREKFFVEENKEYLEEVAGEILDVCREETASILGPSFARDVFGEQNG